MSEANGFTIIMVYLIAWWLVFFMVLPIGAKPSAEMAQGQSTGAPAKAHLGKKVIATTLLSVLAAYGFFLFLGSGIIPVRNL